MGSTPQLGAPRSIPDYSLNGFADYIANGLFSESFGLPETCWRAPVHLDIFHFIILCETDLLFNKLYLQIYYRFVIQI